MTHLPILVLGGYLSGKDDGQPFGDGNGGLFKSFLRQSGIHASQCHFLSTFPETGPLTKFFGPKAEGQPNIRAMIKGKYIRPEWWSHIERLRERIVAFNPNLIIACGEIPLWVTTRQLSLKASRGRICEGNSALPDMKVLPIYDMRQIQSDWTQRPILLADLAKAEREYQFPEVRRPQRYLYLSPSLADMEDFRTTWIDPSPELSVDIETKGEIITCISFAPTPARVMTVPFFCEANPTGNYWPTVREEVMAWQWVKRTLRLGKNLKGQNFQYDMQYFWRFMGITSPDFGDDTMIRHHAMQPEMPKSLGFLGSIYTDEVPWKGMHKMTHHKSQKKEDVE